MAKQEVFQRKLYAPLRWLGLLVTWFGLRHALDFISRRVWRWSKAVQSTPQPSAEEVVDPPVEEVEGPVTKQLKPSSNLSSEPSSEPSSNPSSNPSSSMQRAMEAAAGLTDLSSIEQLALYGLYKQSTLGPCDVSKPGVFDMVGRAKWTAWKELGSLSSQAAMQKYAETVRSLTVVASIEAGQAGAAAAAAAGAASRQDSGGGMDDLQMGAAQSRMADDDEDEIADADKDIYFWASENNIEQVSKLIAAGVSLSAQDQAGLTALHWAVDRGHVGMVQYLLDLGSDMDARDHDDSTPLHYAVNCEHEELVVLLLRRGANSTITDSDGSTPLDLADKTIAHLFD